MDDADRADVAYRRLRAAERDFRYQEGPKPLLVTLCLFCGKEIETVKLEDAAKARRWCCAACRDSWEKENSRGRQ